MRNAARMGWSGFTTKEFLVVVGLLAVIFVLLVPAINTRREKGNRVVCADNFRRLGVALAVYMHDHQGRLPPVYQSSSETTWDSVLIRGGYLFAYSLRCPSDRIARPAGTQPRTYALSAGRDMNKSLRWLRGESGNCAVLTNRADIVLAGERPWGNGPSVVGGIGGAVCDKRWVFSAHFWTTTPENYRTYNKTSNYLFFDGHVEWIENPTEELLNSMFPQ